MNFVNLIELALGATLRMSTPLFLASLGGIFASRSGIMALGLEGMISVGAFSAVLGSYIFGNGVIGILTGVLVGALVGVFNAWLCIKYHVNHVIAGLGVNMMVAALTSILLQVIWNSSSNSPKVASVRHITVPVLSEIPVAGALFTNQSVVTYLGILIIPLVWCVLFKTVFGVRVRVIGNNPYSASTAGVNVNRYKYTAMFICGAFAGLAGAYLSVCQLDLFMESMSAERGYISNVICALGAYNPIGIFLASIFFGFADAGQIFLKDTNIPPQLMRTLPYIATLIALMVVKNKSGAAMFVGKHFDER